eukprot:GFKZ01007128.1.p1 GENE.GFKZ01007128.1~~GFKZ01007128.1.p1  ORF type:complete len:428 (-),score=71.05 GFKZ01007128.1:4-1287(-)
MSSFPQTFSPMLSSHPSPTTPSQPPPQFSLGLEIAHHDLDLTPSHSSPGCTSPTFVPAIMHRAVDARCFVSTVVYGLSHSQLAQHLALDEHLLHDPNENMGRKSNMDGGGGGGGGGGRWGGKRDAETEGGGNGKREENDKTVGGLDRDTFADLLMASKCMDEEVVRFGKEVVRRLEGLTGVQGKGGRYGVGVRRRNVRRDWAGRRDVSMRGSSGSSSSAGMVDSSGSCSGVGANTCGFSEKGSHIDVEVLCEGLGICKTGKGLYRTARSVGKVRSGCYFEVVVVEDWGCGGICIGVATAELGLNKLVGSDRRSVGLHSSGQVVRRGGEFGRFGRGFGKGDRVGCAVRVGEGGMCEDGGVEVEYWVNGEWLGCVKEDLGKGVENGEVGLFAAVSLYKKGSKAVMQCCEKDWRLVGDGCKERESVCGGR